MLMRVLLSITSLGFCATTTAQASARTLGNKSYEVSNHLGNVMAVVSDRKKSKSETSNTSIVFTETDIKAYNDYYPYGMLLDIRSETKDYRFGFQGQEKDDEVNGKNNSINYKYRVHDPRLGRFFAIDPLFYQYPANSSYAFSENIVINSTELEGQESKVMIVELNNRKRIQRITYYTIDRAANQIDNQYNGVSVYTVNTSRIGFNRLRLNRFKTLLNRSANMRAMPAGRNITESITNLRTEASNYNSNEDRMDEDRLNTAEINRFNDSRSIRGEIKHTPQDRFIYFNHDNATIDWNNPNNASEQRIMQGARADYILKNENLGDYKIVLEAHTSLIGDVDYNQKLAQKRGEMVRDYLVSLGADVDKIEIKVVGESRSSDKDSADDGSQANSNSAASNRVVTFRFYKE